MSFCCRSDKSNCLITKAGVPYTLDQCRRCWKRLNDPVYAAWCEAQIAAGTPSLGAKLVNFAGAVAKHVATGAKRVSEEEAKRRLDICEGCPMKDPAAYVCRHPKCGCFLAGQLLAKTAWESQHCPLGKW